MGRLQVLCNKTGKPAEDLEKVSTQSPVITIKMNAKEDLDEKVLQRVEASFVRGTKELEFCAYKVKSRGKERSGASEYRIAIYYILRTRK